MLTGNTQSTVRKNVNSNPAATALIWTGSILFIVGCIVGLTPYTDVTTDYGSAWFPKEFGAPGMHNAPMSISIVLLLIGGAAGITGAVLLSQNHSSEK